MRILKANPKNIRYCAKQLRTGAVVAIPTETVYGLAALCNHHEAIHSIFQIKKRPSHHPLIVHVGLAHLCSKSLIQDEIIGTLTAHQTQWLDQLIHTFWPGPLSIILPKGNKISPHAIAHMPYVAIRMPAVDATLKLIHSSKAPLVAPSANIYTKLSPTSAQMVAKSIDVATILDAGPCSIGIESTILSLLDKEPLRILRPGSISKEQIQNCLQQPVHAYQPEAIPTLSTSGQSKAHYQPACPLVLLENRIEKLTHQERLQFMQMITGKKINVCVSDPSRLQKMQAFLQHSPALQQSIHSIAPTENLMSIAQNLFAKLEELSQEWIDIIIVEPLAKDDQHALAQAIHNRLSRAHHVFKKEKYAPD